MRLDTHAPLTAGARLGSYRLTAEIARGGTATVYRASHLVLDREVALKVLHGERCRDGAARTAFLEEARLQAGFRHRRILRLIDAQGGAQPFLVLPLVDGDLLRHLQRHGRLNERGAVQALAMVAEGLAEMHAAGLVHRDIKPGNILVQGGQLTIGDLGLATPQGVSVSRRFEGTPAYCAPEVFRREQTAPSADIWSLGATFYALLTATEAVPGRGVDEIRQAVLAGTVRHPGALGIDVSDPALTLLQAMLDRDPARRPEARTIRRRALQILRHRTAPQRSVAVAA